MRRLLALSIPVIALAGCSGLGKYESDTLTLPGANPNVPAGATETMNRVTSRPVNSPGLETESGNVWPGEPKPFPTLGEVEKETQNGQTGAGGDQEGGGQGGGGRQGTGTATTVGVPGGMQGGGTPGSFKMQSNPNSASTITIPNGNGTSTVIAPDGSVRVIPTPGGSGASGAATPAPGAAPTP